MTHPSAAPDTAPRAILYLRQSTHREESISLELQETAGRDYCARQGYQVIAVEADPGVSGRTWNRPAVQRVMTMIDDGHADVIVLWKWSRLSRSRRDWAIAADRVDMAGGRIESATEPVDVATSVGRLARGMMTEFAAFESERIGDTWKEAHARRISQGRPANGKARFGYIYNAAEKLHEPDPETGPVLAETYRRYLAGESLYSLTKWLNDAGVKTASGYSSTGPGPWSARSLRRVLDSGFAAGLITYRGETRPGAHQALITPDQWTSYKAARERRAVHRGSERSEYLLSGMIRCACGGSMNAGLFGTGRAAKYRCKAANEQRRHQGGYVTATRVEDAVLAWLREIAQPISGGVDVEAAARTHLARRQRDAKSLSREILQLDDQLTRLTIQHVRGVIPEAAFIGARDEIGSDRARAASLLQQAEADLITPPSRERVRSLLDDWDLLPVPQRRTALKQLIARVIVTPGRPVSTIEIIPIWSR